VIDNSYFEKILSGRDMRTLNLVAEENIGNKEKINIGSMCRHEYNWSIYRGIIVFQSLQDLLAHDDDLLIDLIEDF